MTERVNEVSGRGLLRALKYAFAACPKGDANEALSHIIFTDERLIAGDGYRWQISYLGDDVKLSSFAATRASVNKLILLLAATVRAVGNKGIVDTEIRGSVVTIKYGTETLDVELDSQVVGPIPSKWEPPVPESAPLLFDAPPGLAAEFVSQATRWPGARVTWRGQGNGPVRIDLEAHDDMLYATAVILPAGQRATLPDQRQLSLLKKRKKSADAGISVLSLELERVDLETGEVMGRAPAEESDAPAPDSTK
jgi:hypothetical protein